MVRELGLAMEITLDYRNGDDLVSAEEVERSVRSLKDGDREVWDEGEEQSSSYGQWIFIYFVGYSD
uniref:Uncharacterized protein n=1 Tax=Nelumbo nucifera TaxID=4432 RepID=A0A822ZKT4_NELNU|nr:TPA_asm: hypothetical protein HUJ06_002275 [Nelumbo nucifera]